MKTAKKGLLGEKNHQNLTVFEAFFLKLKQGSATKVIYVSDHFKMVIPLSATFVLEVLLEVASKGSFRGKKTLKNWDF